MKTPRLILLACALALAVPVAVTTSGCAAPSSRAAEVKTLKIIAASVDASMKLAAQLKADGRITVAQWQKIADFYDANYAPVFRVAVVAVQSNLDSIASPDLIALAGQLAALVNQYLPKP